MTAENEPIPLARLLAMSFRTMIDELHARLGQRGWSDVRPAYGFVLLALRDGPTSAKDVAALMGTTKQAAEGARRRSCARGRVGEGFWFIGAISQKCLICQ